MIYEYKDIYIVDIKKRKKYNIIYIIYNTKYII